MTKKYYINGPESVYRLEGEIDGNKKIIYIFGENHSNYKECENYNNSIDIDKYILKILKKNIKIDKNKFFDLFVEMYDEYRYEYNTNLKYDNHIDKIRKLVSHNTKIINDKIHINKDLINTRFHFFDIRNIFEKYLLDLDIIEEIIYNYCYYNDEYKLNYLKKNLYIFK